MKYWAYFGAKLVAVVLFLCAVWDGMFRLLPEPEPFLRYRVSRMGQDLAWTTLILLYFLFGIGLVYVAIWDQRMRCRSCLRRLRMPLETGSWSRATLLSPPQRRVDLPLRPWHLDRIRSAYDGAKSGRMDAPRRRHLEGIGEPGQAKIAAAAGPR